MKHTIVVATTLTDEALAVLRGAKDVEVLVTGPDPARVQKALESADALIIRDELSVDAALLAAGKRLRVIGRAGVGLAGIDVEMATTRGVIVMHTPGANAIAACESTSRAASGRGSPIPASNCVTKRSA
jgi:D-3-phosphoglycerate dehydrogenase